MYHQPTNQPTQADKALKKDWKPSKRKISPEQQLTRVPTNHN
jgi:hypothetical protein